MSDPIVLLKFHNTIDGRNGKTNGIVGSIKLQLHILRYMALCLHS
ncbi:hypothetical protein KCTCHS21_06640 [Cohnella abietis]|uniref:Uncharacterized protein n=1 Tax=Cohnella abietis TaxID=2507935 RepID=A0A3T1CZS6_9BACL|nr:hypothetical protein KCTCHS21_06640 [Cohnella abietis]